MSNTPGKVKLTIIEVNSENELQGTTGAVKVVDPATESVSGLAETQRAVNVENKQEIEYIKINLSEIDNNKANKVQLAKTLKDLPLGYNLRNKTIVFDTNFDVAAFLASGVEVGSIVVNNDTGSYGGLAVQITGYQSSGSWSVRQWGFDKILGVPPTLPNPDRIWADLTGWKRNSFTFPDDQDYFITSNDIVDSDLIKAATILGEVSLVDLPEVYETVKSNTQKIETLETEAERIVNKTDEISDTPSSVKYPTERAAKDYTDQKVASAVSLGTNAGHFWYGKTQPQTVVPDPTIIVDGYYVENYFDFTTNTPYTPAVDGSGWVAGTVLQVSDGFFIDITKHFLDIAEGQLQGRAVWSELEQSWGIVPSYNFGIDQDTIRRRVSDGAMEVGSQTIETITEDTTKFNADVPMTFKYFWQSVFNKINGIIQALTGKVNKSGDTMTGALKIKAEGATILFQRTDGNYQDGYNGGFYSASNFTRFRTGQENGELQFINNNGTVVSLGIVAYGSYNVLDMYNHNIIRLANPTNATDAANKQYVDGKFQVETTDTVATAPVLNVSENNFYKYTQPLTSLDISNFVDSNKEILIKFITGLGFTLTMHNSYFNKNQDITFNENEPYEINIRNGIVRIG